MGWVMVMGEVALAAVRVYCLSGFVVLTVWARVNVRGAPLFIHVAVGGWLRSLASPWIVRMVPLASWSMPIMVKVTVYCVW